MPASITIRDIPDEVYAKIKERAELNHRSVNSEVVVYLKRLVQNQRRNPEELINRAEQIKKKGKGELKMVEIQHAIDLGRP